MLGSTLLYGVLTAAAASAHTSPKHVEYSVVPGLFLQDANTTNPSGFDYIATNFGLINRTYPSDSSCPDRKSSTQWQRLSHYIETLNKKSPRNERYSLL
jgi:hypothetical protein